MSVYRKHLKSPSVGGAFAQVGWVYSSGMSKPENFTKEMLEELKEINASFSEEKTLFDHILFLMKENDLNWEKNVGSMEVTIPSFLEDVASAIQGKKNGVKMGRIIGRPTSELYDDFTKLQKSIPGLDAKTRDFMSYVLHQIGQPSLPGGKITDVFYHP